tara:strand:- start:1442 stop:1636 length:195 start_codon:yes stop_codon:yes gene_type:complete
MARFINTPLKAPLKDDPVLTLDYLFEKPVLPTIKTLFPERLIEWKPVKKKYKPCCKYCGSISSC